MSGVPRDNELPRGDAGQRKGGRGGNGGRGEDMSGGGGAALVGGGGNLDVGKTLGGTGGGGGLCDRCGGGERRAVRLGTIIGGGGAARRAVGVASGTGAAPLGGECLRGVMDDRWRRCVAVTKGWGASRSTPIEAERRCASRTVYRGLTETPAAAAALGADRVRLRRAISAASAIDKSSSDVVLLVTKWLSGNGSSPAVKPGVSLVH